ncbi:MAG: M48 family metallopeptidase [Oligoflexales bacterium]|nr:M48 family metallopeptidase [Oligoflexales bacterium]
MNAVNLLYIYVGFRIFEQLFDTFLGTLNRRYYSRHENQITAKKLLGISDEDFNKSLAYSSDKFIFGQVSGWINLSVTLAFLVLGGFAWVETQAQLLSTMFNGNSIVTGLCFFGILGLLSMVVSLPFSYYSTFVIEQKHGFNRNTPARFFVDLIKGLVIGVLLGGAILALLLWIIENTGSYWWLYAWLAMTGFSLLTVWLYPTFLAPLFNKFSPLSDGDLKSQIESLAKKVGFETDGISVMNASLRSAHGNAYFTGVLGKKKIVLFDTLIEAMTPRQVTAVLAHELGHFKLHHVRGQLIRSTLMTGGMFYLLSILMPHEVVYSAFYLNGISYYGAFLVFSMWFQVISFFTQPLLTYVSRQNEFAADAFALQYIEQKDELSNALLKLREKSQAMPISHPWYSAYHYSHPPMLERLAAMAEVN